ncbi:LOW QUALITY PROTEIN: BTB/POZ domain-containing protein 7-like [Diaphorina citri]|uniref:LOW QUALITY PROTEIN: BTB/POZ domain-containing protein 7-like n=1 Tax=Diaphorina citri TaxID=121845 RepID=A0A3Q0J5T4_DIACI|nr:LOW QUALITY PROTEIN: BTB/POZ domain-containing protein 7-like [Diaphorina citri]
MTNRMGVVESTAAADSRSYDSSSVFVRDRKKLKMTGFATLRKKLIRKRRSSKASDHGRVIRELISEWTPLEVSALLEEYEALQALKDLSVQAELARPPAATYKQDLATLYEYKYCTDLDLIFRGSCFPIHRAILSARCPFFRNLLSEYPGRCMSTVLSIAFFNFAGISVTKEIRKKLAAGVNMLSNTFYSLSWNQSLNSNYDYNSTHKMAWSIYHYGLAIVMVVTGSINTLSTKWADYLEAVGADGKLRKFDHPFFQSCSMFLGELLCLLAFKAIYSYYVYKQDTLADVRELVRGNRNFSPLLFIPPAMCDMVATSLMYIGLNLTYPSSFQMLRGDMLIVMAQIITAVQMIYEEKYVTKLDIPALQAVGWEGFFGLVILGALQIPFYYIYVGKPFADNARGTLEDFPDAFVQLSNNHLLIFSVLGSNGIVSDRKILGEVEALTHTGRIRPSALEEAMELYQIGRFLELDIVAQGCEDLILEHLTLESLPTVLRWGSQPHGSPWVGRQARHFLREEFSAVASSPVLFQLDKKHLIEALQSDFLLASELDVLSAVLKWGENQLVRRIEDREPNLVSQTAHSVSRKGIKKRDLNDVELRELLSELLPLVRMDHVIPQNSDILCQAIRRGLVSTPPSHMMGNDNRDLLPRVNAWVRTPNAQGLFVRPRLFQPYYDEIKALLEDQMVQELDLMRYRRTCYVPDIPDTLYMIDKKPRSHSNPAASLPPSVPIPDSATMNAMLKREEKLRASPYCQRAQSLPLSSHHNINRQIRLRVVREFNLPDSIADILENAVCYCNEEEAEEEGAVMSSQSCGRYATNSKSLSRKKKANELPAIITEQDLYRQPECESSSCSDGHLSEILPDVAMATSINKSTNELPAIITEQDLYRQPECESSSCSDGHLSEILPDVAMATSINQISSSLNQVSVNQEELLPPELELDLGNGTVPPFRRSNHTTFYPPPHRFI